MGDLTQKQAASPVFIVGSDSVGSETVPVNSTAQGELLASEALSVGGVYGFLSVSTSAVEAKVGASALTDRKILTVMPTDGSIFWGYSNAVTALTGTEIFRNQLATFAVRTGVAIWLIAAGSRNVRVTEGA